MQQTLEALVDGDRFELVRDDHAHEGAHGGVHSARRSADVYDRHSLVLQRRTLRSRAKRVTTIFDCPSTLVRLQFDRTTTGLRCSAAYTQVSVTAASGSRHYDLNDLP